MSEIQKFGVIDGVEIQQVQATMSKIANFQAVVRNTLKEGQDFGIIPGTQKPTLLKPGAEKILMLLGLTSEYEVTERVQDYDKGFFAFTVKCVLSRTGLKVTEGVGHANTRERRYTSGKQSDPFTLANTVLKMAKKRAQVDAVLTVASLSEVFTQDLEDLSEDAPPEKPGGFKPAGGDAISQAQRNFALKLAGHFEKDEAKRAEWIKARYGVDLAKATKAEGSKLIEQLQADIAADNEAKKQQGELLP
jgi:hypothetical protein